MTANTTEVRDMTRVKTENHRKRVRVREREEGAREKEVRGKQMETEIDI